MSPTDIPPPRRGRAGRGMTLPRGGRGARGGRGGTGGVSSPSVGTPTSAAVTPTAVMTPITPAATFPQLRVVPGSAQSGSSLGTPLSASTVAATPTVDSAASSATATGTATGAPAGAAAAARRARAGLRGAIGARRAVMAPRFRGRRTAEERAALAQAERDRFGAEIAEKEKQAREAGRGRGRGRGVRGRDSNQGRGNRESRWARGGRGGAFGAIPIPTAPELKTDPFHPSDPFTSQDDMVDIDSRGLSFPPPPESSDESEEDELGPRVDVGSESFGAAGRPDDPNQIMRLMQPIRIPRIDHDAATDLDQDVGVVATGLSAASRERPPPPPRKWKGVWQDSDDDDDDSDDLNAGNSVQTAGAKGAGAGQDGHENEDDDEDEKSNQPVFRTKQHRDEYARLKRSRARLVSLLGNMSLGDTKAEKNDSSAATEASAAGTKDKKVSFVDPAGSESRDSSSSVQSAGAMVVKVKSEPTDTDDHDLDLPMADVMPEIDPELLPKSEPAGEDELKPSTDGHEAREDRLFLFQFPPLMPRLLPREAAVAERAARAAAEAEARAQTAAVVGTSNPNSTRASGADGSSSTAAAAAAAAAARGDAGDGEGAEDEAGFPPPHAWFEPKLSSGKAGKMRVHRSGKVTLDIGGNRFLVHEGIEVGFLQTGMVVKLPKEKKAKKKTKEEEERAKAKAAVKTEGGVATKGKRVKKEPGEDVMDLELSSEPDGGDSGADEDDDGPDEEVGAYSMGPISGKFVSSVYWEKTLGKESTLFM